MYNSKVTGRLNEIINSGYSDGVDFWDVDRDGSLVKRERPQYQVQTARDSSVKLTNKKQK